LRPFISHYAGFCADGLPPGTHTGLPSHHAHLIISLGDPIDVLRMPDPSQRGGRFTALVGGLHDAPATVRRGGRFDGVHVFLTPFGVRAILGASPPELASRVFELSDVWGPTAGDLIERLRGRVSWRARFALLDDVFARASTPIEPHPAVLWTWQQLASSHGDRSIQALARDVGWSRQHLTDRFRGDLGVPPKTAARIFRFERACRLIRDSRLRLADVAASCGYHDQAHMSREWNALAGCSPGAWIAGELPFLQDYELQGRENEAGG
jgi:AraC-like DNA-binding protein